MKQFFALALAVSLVAPPRSLGQSPPPAPAPQEIAVLQLKVIEGEGVVHTAGVRTGAAFTVQVSDETGRPVEGVTVSFRMPAEGATGVFESGLPTEVLVTGADGKASVWGVRWNKITGPVRVRITAVKGDVRAGIFSSQYVAEPQAAAKQTEANRPTTSKARNRWLAIAVIAAGAAAGGLVLGVSGKAQTSAQGISDSLTSVQVGAPSIQIGKP